MISEKCFVWCQRCNCWRELGRGWWRIDERKEARKKEWILVAFVDFPTFSWSCFFFLQSINVRPSNGFHALLFLSSPPPDPREVIIVKNDTISIIINSSCTVEPKYEGEEKLIYLLTSALHFSFHVGRSNCCCCTTTVRRDGERQTQQQAVIVNSGNWEIKAICK